MKRLRLVSALFPFPLCASRGLFSAIAGTEVNRPVWVRPFGNPMDEGLIGEDLDPALAEIGRATFPGEV